MTENDPAATDNRAALGFPVGQFQRLRAARGHGANFNRTRRTDLLKQVWSKAESKFRASQKKDDEFLKEKERNRKENAEKLARLRAQRMEKENADGG